MEEIDTQVYILPLLTLADVLMIGMAHASHESHVTTHATPTFIVDMWKGVAIPKMGRTIASYLRSIFCETNDYYNQT